MLNKFKEIEPCGYECEAGRLELNIVWQELKERVGRYEDALKDIASHEGDYYEDEVACIAKEALED